MAKSSEHKHKIEQNQRALIKDRTKKGKTWESRWFKADGEEWTFKHEWTDEESLRKIIFSKAEAPEYSRFWLDGSDEAEKKEKDESEEDEYVDARQGPSS